MKDAISCAGVTLNKTKLNPRLKTFSVNILLAEPSIMFWHVGTYNAACRPVYRKYDLSLYKWFQQVTYYMVPTDRHPFIHIWPMCCIRMLVPVNHQPCWRSCSPYMNISTLILYLPWWMCEYTCWIVSVEWHFWFQNMALCRATIVFCPVAFLYSGSYCSQI